MVRQIDERNTKANKQNVTANIVYSKQIKKY